MPICKAKAKSTGKRCRRQVTPGRKVCYFHGGKSLAGQAHPGWKHGRRSSHMPARIAERYMEALNDPELMELKQDVALIEARIGQVLEALDTGESRSAWTALVYHRRAFHAAEAAGEDKGMVAAIKAIMSTISRGVGERATWDDLRVLLQEKAALGERERKRMVDAQQMLTVEEAMALAAGIAHVLRDTIGDRDLLLKVLDGIDRLTRRGDAVDTEARVSGE